jgi:hypothetical protein
MSNRFDKNCGNCRLPNQSTQALRSRQRRILSSWWWPRSFVRKRTLEGRECMTRYTGHRLKTESASAKPAMTILRRVAGHAPGAALELSGLAIALYAAELPRSRAACCRPNPAATSYTRVAARPGLRSRQRDIQPPCYRKAQSESSYGKRCRNAHRP